MNKERSAFEKIRLGKQEIISFLLPLLAMLGIFVAKGVFPFGKESFLLFFAGCILVCIVLL